LIPAQSPPPLRIPIRITFIFLPPFTNLSGSDAQISSQVTPSIIHRCEYNTKIANE
jgi:hypothetical protein